MDNLTEQIKDINIARFDMAICNGTIEKELEQLSDLQLNYLNSLIDLDETLEDKTVLMDYVYSEINNRCKVEKILNINKEKYLTTSQLLEKVCILIVDRLEFLDDSNMLLASIESTETLVLKNIIHYLSGKELTPKKQFIMESIENELKNREEKSKQYIL